MMATIIRPAALVMQGQLKLYSTSLRVQDLISRGFCSVETLDPDLTNDNGYQRLLNKGRAKKLASYILDGIETRDAFLPTSIFLATERDIAQGQNNTIEIDIGQVGPFSVVDGQHRIEGLRIAAESNEKVLDFEVPVNIAVNLNNIAQMCHFLIVNTTQKSVEQSIEQRILQRLTNAIGVDETPTLPRWIKKAIDKGEDDRALRYVDHLNNDADSPWHKKINMANAPEKDGTINQQSFVKAIKRYILVNNNPIPAIHADKQYKIFQNYWTAIIKTIGNEEEATVLFKYNGVDVFCRFAVPFFNVLINKNNFTVKAMTTLLESCFELVEGEYAGVGHSDFWMKGGPASRLNSGANSIIITNLVAALHKSNNMSKDIEI